MIRSFTSLFLASILVIGNLWIPVYTHTCKLFDESEVSLFSGQLCCENEPTAGLTLSNFKCCSLELKTIKSVDSSILQHLAPAIHADFTLPEFFSFGHLPGGLYLKNILHSRPPPARVFNRALLIFIQVFRL